MRQCMTLLPLVTGKTTEAVVVSDAQVLIAEWPPEAIIFLAFHLQNDNGRWVGSFNYLWVVTPHSVIATIHSSQATFHSVIEATDSRLKRYQCTWMMFPQTMLELKVFWLLYDIKGWWARKSARVLRRSKRSIGSRRTLWFFSHSSSMMYQR